MLVNPRVEKNKSSAVPIVAAIFLGAIFAFLVVVAKELSGTLNLQQQVYGRSFIALILVILVYRRHFYPNKLRELGKNDILISLVRGLVLYVGAVSLISYSAIHSTVFLTSVLGVLPFAVIFGIVFFKEKLTKYRLIALLVAFLGVVAISNPTQANFRLGAGEWAAIASSALFAVAYVTRRLNSPNITNPQISSLMYLSGTIGLVTISLLLNQKLLRPSQFNLHTSIWLVIGGILNLFNIMLVNYVFQRLPAITANILLTIEFVFATTFGYLFYSQVPILIEFIGALLITGSIILLALSEQRAKGIE